MHGFIIVNIANLIAFLIDPSFGLYHCGVFVGTLAMGVINYLEKRGKNDKVNSS